MTNKTLDSGWFWVVLFAIYVIVAGSINRIYFTSNPQIKNKIEQKIENPHETNDDGWDNYLWAFPAIF